MAIDEAEFESHVLAALDSLPPEFAEHLSNLEVMVEPRPRAEHRRAAGIKPWQTLYGLYQGIPLTRRRSSYGLVVLHEIAHHFGISDERLHELDAY